MGKHLNHEQSIHRSEKGISGPRQGKGRGPEDEGVGPAHNTMREDGGGGPGEAGSKPGSIRWAPDHSKEFGS